MTTSLAPLPDKTRLRRQVRLLGDLLGDIIIASEGQEFLETVQQIRKLSKSARLSGDFQTLKDITDNLSDDDALAIARAFSHFLNLANIADQHDSVISHRRNPVGTIESISALCQQVPRDDFQEAIANLHIDLVLTAHPTEITRRTMIHKYQEIDACLSQLEQRDIEPQQQRRVTERLTEMLAQTWHTTEFRVNRPTPVDEAKWGYAVVENSLWQAVPTFLRSLEETLTDASLPPVPVNWTPVQFSSWMGGDRDGNPTVTSDVTEQALLLSRWQACDLFARDLNRLIEELSMSDCGPALTELVGDSHEPYRAILRPLRNRLVDDREALTHVINSGGTPPPPLSKTALLEPLQCCYDSLVQQGLHGIARGPLLDTLRRAHCFGPHLVRLDIRQDSAVHSSALMEITEALGLGRYDEWSEDEKIRFLSTELENPRPLLPRNWSPTPETRELLDTLQVIARQPREALGCYIISMAREASDVLAVALLLNEFGGNADLPVVPLFETLTDLENAPRVMTSLFDLPVYRDRIDDFQMIMIGYSDSAKDAGALAAGWEQYRAQEQLLALGRQRDIRMRLFHGRGGSIGRGGAPAHAALLSQPPGSLRHGLRVTEQGEMIRTKLGLPALALNTLSLYSAAILEANLSSPPEPTPGWRDAMDELAENSCKAYRQVIRDESDFVKYFRQATPELELGQLPLGSRPARRRTDGGIESLRAIPWIFAWTQNRLMLPAWLGAGAALHDYAQRHGTETLEDMTRHWPFFATRLSMLCMVYAKADANIAAHYDEELVEPALQSLGASLREQLATDTQTVLSLLGHDELLADDPWGLESIKLRDVYTAPLNILQATLLKRARRGESDSIAHAIMVSIAGIAAGMRNTG